MRVAASMTDGTRRKSQNQDWGCVREMLQLGGGIPWNCNCRDNTDTCRECQSQLNINGTAKNAVMTDVSYT